VISVRLKILLTTLALAGTLASHAGAVTKIRRAAVLELAIVAEMNDVRRDRGLTPLQRSPELNAAATAHSLEMARHGYFAHRSADGTVFWIRVRRFYGYGDSTVWSVGENLLWTAVDLDAERVVQWWLRSPAHRDVLFEEKWRDIGLAALEVSDAPGFYRGRDVTLVTANFGARR
jgi:uncharacterized protein YkwD